MRAWVHPVTKGVVMTHSRQDQLALWRQTISRALVAHLLQQDAWELMREPVAVSLTFTFVRPMSHLSRDGSVLSRRADDMPHPDIDKLARAVLDAMTGIVYDDDKRVTRLTSEKTWGERSGVTIWWRRA